MNEINNEKELKLYDVVNKLKAESTESFRIDENMMFCEI